MFNSFIACPVSADSITLTGFICKATLVVLEFVPILIALAMLYFLWGAAQWILNLNNEEKIKEGRERVVWGLVALFFILSIGGVIAILMNTFFHGGTANTGTNRFAQPINQPGGVSAVHAPIDNASGQQIGFWKRTLCGLRLRSDCN